MEINVEQQAQMKKVGVWGILRPFSRVTHGISSHLLDVFIIAQLHQKASFVTSANRNIAKPASKTFGNAMNRQDSEINAGRKVSNATAHAAGAAYRWSKGKMGF